MREFFFSMLFIIGLVFPSYMSIAEPGGLTDEEKEQYTEDRIEELSDIIRRVMDNYYFEDKADIDEMIDDAIESVLESIEDQHSMYIPAHKVEQFERDFYGEDAAGIGIRYAPYPEYVRIVQVFENSPAMNVGLQRQDVITHVNGNRIRNLPINIVSDLLTGPVDSNVSLTINRNENTITFEITRTIISYQSVTSAVLPDNIGYIRIEDFTRETAEDFYLHVMRMSMNIIDPVGLIIDLRYNLGGLLDEALIMSDMMISEGILITIRRRGIRDRVRYAVGRTVVPTDIPVVVLINGMSASASEVLSGALQDNDRAVLIGTQSFGKGSIQTIYKLGQHGSILKFTTGIYMLPSGNSIDVVGIEPDIIVEQTIDTSLGESYILSEEVNVSYSLDPSVDAQLNEAIQYLINN